MCIKVGVSSLRQHKVRGNIRLMKLYSRVASEKGTVFAAVVLKQKYMLNFKILVSWKAKQKAFCFLFFVIVVALVLVVVIVDFCHTMTFLCNDYMDRLGRKQCSSNDLTDTS